IFAGIFATGILARSALFLRISGSHAKASAARSEKSDSGASLGPIASSKSMKAGWGSWPLQARLWNSKALLTHSTSNVRSSSTSPRSIEVLPLAFLLTRKRIDRVIGLLSSNAIVLLLTLRHKDLRVHA